MRQFKSKIFLILFKCVGGWGALGCAACEREWGKIAESLPGVWQDRESQSAQCPHSSHQFSSIRENV